MTGLVGKTGMFLFYFNMCNTHCVLAPGGQKMCRDPEFYCVAVQFMFEDLLLWGNVQVKK